MQPFTYVSQLTGLSLDEIGDKVRIVADAGKVRITKWDASLPVAQPTDDAFQAALVAPDPPPPAAQLTAYASAKQDDVLAQVWAFNVGTSSAPIKLTTKLDRDGQSAMLELLVWGKTLAADGDVQHYNMADGSPGPDLTAAEAVSLAAQAGLVKAQSYKTLNDLAAGILASPPTITAFSDIDKASWPVPQT